MRKKLVSLLLALCLLLLCGCSSAPGDRSIPDETEVDPLPTLKEDRADSFGLSYQEDAGLNPYDCTRLVNRPVISLLYQGLFTVTSQYKAEPVLCRTFRCSPDLKTWVFTLMNARFSDGTELTASDVVASLREARGSDVYGNRLRHVDSISATDDKEITITMEIGYGNLPVLLDIPIVKASQVDDDTPLGTGPYALAGSEDSPSLKRLSNWWSDYPPAVDFDTIPLAKTENPSDIRDQFEFGLADLVCADPSSASFVEYRCDYELWDCATGIMLYLGCNTAGRSTFANGSLRAALTHGIDRSALKEVYRGFAQVATLPASPEADCYDSILAAHYGYDPSLYADTLRDTGLMGVTTYLLVCSDNPVRVTAAQVIADQLNELGMNVTLNALPREKYLKALEVGNFDFYLGEVRLSPNFDLSCFFDTGGNLTYGGMADPAISRLCLAALENDGNYYDLFEAIMDDGQLTPLLFRTYAVYATRGTVTSLLPGVDNAFHTANSRQLSTAREDWPSDPTPEETLEEDNE